MPCGPINRIDEVFADPQVQSRGLHIDMPHPLAGSVPLVANPIRLSGSPVAYQRPPPMLGQHTDAVLRELGRSRTPTSPICAKRGHLALESPYGREP